MSDYRDNIRITDEELLEMNNRDLRIIITNLYNQLDEQNKYTARVYAPNKSYKDLEDKLALAENSKQSDIDDLYETKIIPLQNEVKDKKIQLESAYKINERQKEQIKYLEIAAEKLGMLINYAVGYISSCEQFRDKNPDYVKNWLFEGLNENINKPI